MREFVLHNPSDQPGPSQVIVAQHTYIQLAQIRPCLFPSLRVLRCPNVTQSPFYSSLFISPSIRRVELDGLTEENAHITELLISALVYSRYPPPLALDALILRGEVVPGSLTSFFRFTRLRSLEIAGETDLDLLRQIGTLEFLENLVVTLPNHPMQTYDHDSFLRLKSLRLEAPLFLIFQILGRMTTTQLEAVALIGSIVVPTESEAKQLRLNKERDERIEELERILADSLSMNRKRTMIELRRLRQEKEAETMTCDRVTTPSHNHTWNPCFRMLDSRWRTSLLSISISLGKSYQIFNEPIMLGLFSDLSPFAKMETFEADKCNFIPTDEEIQELGLTFPKIKELRLSIDDCLSSTEPTTHPIQRAVTMEGLQTLAKLCPDLRTLQLGLSMYTIPAFEFDGVLSHGLRELSIGSRDAERSLLELLDAGRHIDRLFPFLVDLQVHKGHSGDHWQQIYDIVERYQRVRADAAYRVDVIAL